MKRVDMTPSRVMVTRSPRQEAIGGAMLSAGEGMSQHGEMAKTCVAPGSRPSFRQRTTRKHINEPSRIEAMQVADMAVDRRTMNL